MAGKRLPWLQLNIYPTTQNGDFVVVLTENKGFHYHCSRHEKIKCSMCVDTKKSRVLSSWRAFSEGEEDMYAVLRRMARLIAESDGSNYAAQARLGPIPEATE